MRIINATNKLLIQSDVTLPLIDKNGSKIVTLKPGEFVFIEERGNNSALRLYEQKKMLIVDEQDKPTELDFYQVYNHLDLLQKVYDKDADTHKAFREVVLNDEKFPKALKNEFLNIKDNVANQEEEIFIEKTVLEDSNVNQEEEISIEVIVPEGSIKNKGGRPKGSFTKERRGRPKKKGKPGRPKKRGRPAKRKR